MKELTYPMVSRLEFGDSRRALYHMTVLRAAAKKLQKDGYRRHDGICDQLFSAWRGSLTDYQARDVMEGGYAMMPEFYNHIRRVSRDWLVSRGQAQESAFIGRMEYPLRLPDCELTLEQQYMTVYAYGQGDTEEKPAHYDAYVALREGMLAFIITSLTAKITTLTALLEEEENHRD